MYIVHLQKKGHLLRLFGPANYHLQLLFSGPCTWGLILPCVQVKILCSLHVFSPWLKSLTYAPWRLCALGRASTTLRHFLCKYNLHPFFSLTYSLCTCTLLMAVRLWEGKEYCEGYNVYTFKKKCMSIAGNLFTSQMLWKRRKMCLLEYVAVKILPLQLEQHKWGHILMSERKAWHTVCVSDYTKCVKWGRGEGHWSFSTLTLGNHFFMDFCAKRHCYAGTGLGFAP